MFINLYVRVSILRTRGKNFNDRIISLRVEVWANNYTCMYHTRILNGHVMRLIGVYFDMQCICCNRSYKNSLKIPKG